MKQCFFTGSNGNQLAADCYGDSHRPPVILSHGGGQTRHSWGKAARALAEAGCYAIAYDHRGHGDSDWASDGDYSVDAFARDQLALANALNQPPAVIGASLGGISGMLALGEFQPDCYRALALVDITPRMNPGGAENIMNFMAANLDEGFANLEEAADSIVQYTGRPRRKDVSGLAKNLRRDENGRYRWHWDPQLMSLRGGPSGDGDRLEAAMDAINAPVLLVRGALSDLVTEELAKVFRDRYPGAAYVDVHNAGHMVAGDQNDVFTQAVLDFIVKHC